MNKTLERLQSMRAKEVLSTEAIKKGDKAVVDFCVLVKAKEIEGGKKFFWSICPYWKQKKNSDGRLEKVLHDGDLETQ